MKSGRYTHSVARYTGPAANGVQVVGGSNPLAPTNKSRTYVLTFSSVTGVWYTASTVTAVKKRVGLSLPR